MVTRFSAPRAGSLLRRTSCGRGIIPTASEPAQTRAPTPDARRRVKHAPYGRPIALRPGENRIEVSDFKHGELLSTRTLTYAPTSDVLNSTARAVEEEAAPQPIESLLTRKLVAAQSTDAVICGQLQLASLNRTFALIRSTPALGDLDSPKEFTLSTECDEHYTTRKVSAGQGDRVRVNLDIEDRPVSLLARSIIGYDQSGAAAAKKEQSFFLDFFISKSFPFRQKINPDFGERLKVWGDFRINSVPQTGDVSVGDFAGLRVQTFFFNKYNVPMQRFPAQFALSVGQNEFVTGGRRHGPVVRMESFFPLPYEKMKFINLFATAQIIPGKPNIGTPLVLQPAPADTVVPAANVALVSVPQPNRDHYRIGIGIDFIPFFQKLVQPKTAGGSAGSAGDNAPVANNNNENR